MKYKMITILTIVVMMLSACGSQETQVESDVETQEEANDSSESSAGTSIESTLTANLGVFSAFESIDLEGNVVNQDVLQEAELTVLNLWGTFCGPCIAEMPDLGELSREYDSTQVQIIGVVVDVYDDSGIADALEIIETTEASYLHLLPTEDLVNIYVGTVSAIPETLFLDSQGNILTSVVGSRDKESWKTLIDEVYNELVS
ncbi:MAG: TlpA disulfide reductase family protein [Eubacteriales bacterium]